MNSVLILNKETYEVMQEKSFQKSSLNNSKEFIQNFCVSILEIIKDLDSMNGSSEYHVLKLENKSVVYRKSKDTKLSILIICDKGSIKRVNLVELSKIYLNKLESNLKIGVNENLNNKKLNIDFKTKEYTLQAVEDLTIKFIENLRKNKLFAKFIYYNYNPSVISSISYKKTKLESTSVVLFNTNKDYDKM